MTRNELFSEDTVIELFDLQGNERTTRKYELFIEAEKLKCKKDFEKFIKEHERNEKENNKSNKVLPMSDKFSDISSKKVQIEYDPTTYKPIKSLSNYVKILEGDPYFKDIYYNEQNGNLEIEEEGNIRWYGDADRANALLYIEEEYNGLMQENLFDLAFQTFIEKRKRNPLKEKIESVEWDGKDRISNFLQEFFKPEEDDDIAAETSRLIFAGGINRLYHPGCKFDYVPILIAGQGIGKSTFVRWLNPLEEYYQEVTSVDDKKGAESLQGGFVCEMSELSALKKTKDCETMKAFITRTSDDYRRPYDKFKSCVPRRSIIIGTTNQQEFLNDATGGRRFLPIHPTVSGLEFPNRKSEFKEYIMQCWAEAYAKYKLVQPFMCDLYIRTKELSDKYAKEIAACTTIDDSFLSDIEDYIQDKQFFCIAEIFEFVFDKMISQKSQNKQLYYDISQTIKNISYVKPSGDRMYFDLKDHFDGSTHQWITKKSRQRYYVNQKYIQNLVKKVE